MVLGFHLLLMRMIQGLDSCWNSGVEIVRPGLVVLLEYQRLSASTDNFSVKQWEAVAIHTALKLVRQVRNFVKRWAVLGTTVHNYVFKNERALKLLPITVCKIGKLNIGCAMEETYISMHLC